MKKALLIIGTLLTLISSSCDTDCNDCGNYTSTTYSVKNETGSDMLMRFHKDGTIEESTVKDDETEELYQISVMSQGGFLSAEPFSYDSVHFVINGIVDDTFFKDNCSQQNNPICEKNYSLIKNEEDGNTFVEYRLTISN